MDSIVTIGVPVFNGEKSIRKTLNSVLEQTFENFELIISDNASTDSTYDICKEFTEKDDRIKYVKQKEHSGYIQNFLYLLNNAKSKCFVWLAADDFWDKDFLKKNIEILDKKRNVVGSIGKTGILGERYQKFDENQKDSFYLKKYKKFRRRFLSYDYPGAYGNYEERLKACFKTLRYGLSIYAVYRTTELKKSANWRIKQWDRSTILTVLRYGDLHVIDEVLIYRNYGGQSDNNLIDLYRHKDVKFSTMLFPYASYTKWCLKYLGRKIFLKNLNYFFKINCYGPLIILLGIKNYLASRNSKNREYYIDEDLKLN